jgi:hypothetical protein
MAIFSDFSTKMAKILKKINKMCKKIDEKFGKFRYFS